jgi:hypothetical protein
MKSRSIGIYCVNDVDPDFEDFLSGSRIDNDFRYYCLSNAVSSMYVTIDRNIRDVMVDEKSKIGMDSVFDSLQDRIQAFHQGREDEIRKSE